MAVSGLTSAAGTTCGTPTPRPAWAEGRCGTSVSVPRLCAGSFGSSSAGSSSLKFVLSLPSLLLVLLLVLLVLVLLVVLLLLLFFLFFFCSFSSLASSSSCSKTALKIHYFV